MHIRYAFFLVTTKDPGLIPVMFFSFSSILYFFHVHSLKVIINTIEESSLFPTVTVTKEKILHKLTNRLKKLKKNPQIMLR